MPPGSGDQPPGRRGRDRWWCSSCQPSPLSTPWALPAGGGSPRQDVLPSLKLTLSEVVMTSMPSPSSCVKNCDATLRRVMLSPLLPAMTAVLNALEKKRWAGTSPHHSQRLNPPSQPVGFSKAPHVSVPEGCNLGEIDISWVRGNTKPHL